MKVLVACECSQVVMKAFRANGHDAFSCDIQDCYGGQPQYHIKGDVLDVIEDGWDLMIAHPPCTYLAKSGSCNFGRPGQEDRFHRQADAREFFLKLWNAPIPRICLENPVAMALAALPPWTQVIYPELFGDPFTKQTCLWLKNLPPLIPMFSGIDFVMPSLCGVSRSQRVRSQTQLNVAFAMANQWG